MPDVQKVSITFTGEQVAVLKESVESGEYASISEAVRDALRDWQWRRVVQGDELERLRKLWDEGVASGPGRPMDWDATLAEARLRLQKLTARAA